MNKILTLVLGLLLASSMFAADIDGKWLGSIATPNGDFPQAFSFKADGAKLTGSLAGPEGGDFAIKNGKIDGNNISFSVTLEIGGMSIELNYKGVLSSTEIKFTGEAMGNAFDLVVKKQ